MYMLLLASTVINICSTVAWCRPYPRWYFTIFYFQCFPLAGLRLRFFWYVFPQDRQLLGCFFGRWFLIIPCSFSFCSDLAARSGCSFSLQVCSLLATHLPLRQVFFWPAILTPRYPVSGTPLPLRHVFFWPAILTPRYQLSGTLLPLRRVFFWPAIWTPRYPFSGALLPLHHDFFWPAILTPRSPFPVPQGLLFAPCFGVLDRLFQRPPFFHPTFPSRLLGWPARSLCRLAVRLRFYRSAILPLRGFHRSAVFTAPRFLPLRFRRFFWGLCSSAHPHACCPPVFTHFRAARSLCRLAVRLRFLPLSGFYRSAVFTAPRFLPLRFRRFLGGSALPPPSCLLPPSLHPLLGARSLCRLAVRLRFLPLRGFTAPRFLLLRGFYRSAVFTAPLSPVFWGLCSSAALMLAAPPVFTHFRAARSLCRLAVRLRFLLLRGFYRSAVFTAPLSPVLWGLCSSAALMLAAPQSSPSSGRTLWCRLVHSVSGGPPFLTLFLYRLLNRSRSVTAHLTGFPFVHFIHIRRPSIVSSFGCRDTGTTCTTTSLMGPFGYRKLGNLTYHRLL